MSLKSISQLSGAAFSMSDIVMEGRRGKGDVVGVGAYLSLSRRRKGVEWALITFSAFRMGAYLRWVLIRGRALIRINTLV